MQNNSFIQTKRQIEKILTTLDAEIPLHVYENSDYDLIHDVGLDSLRLINFFLKIEFEFSIEVEFDKIDYSRMRSIHCLVDFINSLLNAKRI
jgi:acyl carrier protein